MHDEAQFVSNPPSGDSANAGARGGRFSMKYTACCSGSAPNWRASLTATGATTRRSGRSSPRGAFANTRAGSRYVRSYAICSLGSHECNVADCVCRRFRWAVASTLSRPLRKFNLRPQGALPGRQFQGRAAGAARYLCPAERPARCANRLPTNGRGGGATRGQHDQPKQAEIDPQPHG